MIKKTNSGTRSIALGGILTALTVFFLFVASYIPGFELTMFAISSIFVAIMLIEVGPKSAFLVFIASAVLGFIIVPNKVALAPYILLFGYYGIAKYYIERINKIAIEILLKFLLFSISFGVGFYLFSVAFLGEINLPEYPTVILALGGIVVFFLYDKIYTGMIVFYEKNIKKRIRR